MLPEALMLRQYTTGRKIDLFVPHSPAGYSSSKVQNLNGLPNPLTRIRIVAECLSLPKETM
jgi:hypothetical protein